MKTVRVVNASTNFSTTVPIAFSSNSFAVTIPLTAIGGDDGYVNTAALMSNISEPTDCVPNGGYLGMYSNITYLPLIYR